MLSTGMRLRLFGRHRDVEVARIGGDAFHRPALAPEVADHDPHARPVVVGDFGNVLREDVLVARLGHLQRRRQVRPQLEAVHAALRIALRHLLVQDAAAGRHPLHVAGAQRAAIAEAVAVIDGAGEDVGDRFDAAMRMPREPGEVVVGALVAEIVEEQERIELAGFAEAEAAVQLDAGAFHGRRGFDDALNRS